MVVSEENPEEAQGIDMKLQAETPHSKEKEILPEKLFYSCDFV